MSESQIALPNQQTALLNLKQLSNPVSAMFCEDVAVGSYCLGFDPLHPDNISLIFQADAGEPEDWRDYHNTSFLLRTWCAKKIQLSNEQTGEMDDVVRVTLFNDDGKCLAFSSKGIVLSLDLLRSMAGSGPYDPPIPIYIKETETRKGRRMLSLFPSEFPAPRSVVVVTDEK